MNIKKAAVIGMCCAIITTSTVFAVSNTANIKGDVKIQINNEWVTVKTKPFIKNDRTLVCLNEFIGRLGAKAESDVKSGEIKISYGDVTIKLIAGEKSGKVNKNSGGVLEEEEINLEVAPELIDGNIFVPIRFVAEAMGFDVEWDDSLRAVIIKGEGDTIVVEKPVGFEAVSQDAINGNEQLLNMYNNNCKTKGIYHLIDGDYIYVLVSAGEKPTGGYSIMVDSVTEVATGTAYIYATLNSPAKESIVTQALTYPSAMIRLEKDAINNFQWDLAGDIKSDEAQSSIVYKNEEYGFNFSLPDSWRGYTIQCDFWKGISLADENKDQDGPIIYIRHPQWTKDNPRQDIPVMVLTLEQWKAVQDEKLAIGAAPIPPGKLGENSKYVFALPARYNFEFLTGYEEVEKILANNPLETFETE